ncbi:MAG: ferrous iron transport protein A [Oscillospiraceae bacterium]|nr:ferrous iron transport protein A [Oscillospiraceae bacterium]
MEFKLTNLKNLESGEYAEVIAVLGEKAIRRRILDVGILPGVRLEVVKRAPLGDPVQISLRGYDLIIRKTEAEKILVSQRKN